MASLNLCLAAKKVLALVLNLKYFGCLPAACCWHASPDYNFRAFSLSESAAYIIQSTARQKQSLPITRWTSNNTEAWRESGGIAVEHLFFATLADFLSVATVWFPRSDCLRCTNFFCLKSNILDSSFPFSIERLSQQSEGKRGDHVLQSSCLGFNSISGHKAPTHIYLLAVLERVREAADCQGQIELIATASTSSAKPWMIFTLLPSCSTWWSANASWYYLNTVSADWFQDLWYAKFNVVVKPVFPTLLDLGRHKVSKSYNSQTGWFPYIFIQSYSE